MIDHRITVITHCVSRWKKSCLRRALKLRGAFWCPQVALILEPDGDSLPGWPAAECEVHRADGPHLLHQIADYLVGDGVGLDCRALTGLPCWYASGTPRPDGDSRESASFDKFARVSQYRTFMDGGAGKCSQVEQSLGPACYATNIDVRGALVLLVSGVSAGASFGPSKAHAIHTNVAFASVTCSIVTGDDSRRLQGSMAVATLPTAPLSDRRALPVVSFHAAEFPRWNAGARILRFKGTVVKRFTKPANNQEHVLMAFEEEGWPEHIDDPIPPHGDIDPKRCLHGTIARLNQHQERRLIRFSGDGRGEGVRWEPIDEVDATLGKDRVPN